MEFYMIVIVVIVAIGILLNIVLNTKSEKKNNTGIIIMTASGVCANLFMLYRLDFSSFGVFIFFITLTAALLFAIYLLANILRRQKERKNKQKIAVDTARVTIPRSRELKKPRSISPDMAAVRADEITGKAETDRRMILTAYTAARRRIMPEGPQAEVLEKRTAADSTGGTDTAGIPLSAEEEQSGPIVLEEDVFGVNVREEDLEILDPPEEEAVRQSAKEAGEAEEADSSAGGTDAAGIPLSAEEEQSGPIVLEEDVSGINVREEDLEAVQFLEEEAGRQSAKAAGEAEEADNGAAENTAGIFETQKEPLDEKQERDEESEERNRQKEILKKAALLQSRGKYLIAYHLYEACVAELADVETSKSAEIAMLDCLVAAGLYADAGKQLFGLLNKKYELGSEEKVKIKEYMELLHKQG